MAINIKVISKFTNALNDNNNWKHVSDSENTNEKYEYKFDTDLSIEIDLSTTRKDKIYLNYLCSDVNPLWIKVLLKYQNVSVGYIDAQELDGGRVIMCEPSYATIISKTSDEHNTCEFAYYLENSLERLLNGFLNKYRDNNSHNYYKHLFDSVIVIKNENQLNKLLKKLSKDESKLISEVNKQNEKFSLNVETEVSNETNHLYKTTMYVKSLLINLN